MVLQNHINLQNLKTKIELFGDMPRAKKKEIGKIEALCKRNVSIKSIFEKLKNLAT